MDPNEALRVLRRALSDAERHAAENDGAADLEALLEAAEAAQALDEWLSKGGFLPEGWRAPIAARLLRNALTGEPDDKLMPEEPSVPEPVKVGPRMQLLVAGPNVVYDWVALETAEEKATIHLRTADGRPWIDSGSRR